jgi:hypothetical protein
MVARAGKKSTRKSGTKKSSSGGKGSKPATKPTKKKGLKGHGKLWNEKRVQIVKALRKIRAFNVGSCRTAEQVSKAAGNGLEPHFVARYCGEKEPLLVEGLVSRADVEGSLSHHYYLTAKGKSCKIEE